MTLLQKLSVRDAQTKLLCTGRMHPRCVRPTTGTLLFNLIQRKRKKGGFCACCLSQIHIMKGIEDSKATVSPRPAPGGSERQGLESKKVYLTNKNNTTWQSLRGAKNARLGRRYPKATVGIVHTTVHAREGWWDKKSVVDVISFEMKMKHGDKPTHI